MHVVIVGAGLLGLSTAYFLRSEGAAVTVIERGAGAARETSFANGGMLTPSMPEPWNSPHIAFQLFRALGRNDASLIVRLRALPSLSGWGIRFLSHSRRPQFEASTAKNIRLALYSMQALSALRQKTGIDYERSPSGTLRIFRHPLALERAIKRAEFLQNLGIRFEALDVERMLSLEPALATTAAQLAGSIYYPHDEVGNAQLFCERLAAALERIGAQLVFNTTVTGWRSSDRRIAAVLTSEGTLTADAFVLAAGAYSTRLARSLGLYLPVQPAKGYSVTIPAPRGGPRVPVIDDALHAAVVPIGTRLRVAGTAEFAGFDSTLAPARISALFGLLKQLYPSIHSQVDSAAALAWSGLRPMAADGVPILGATSLENLYVNTGHGPLGWTMAAGSGKAVADLILTGRSEINLSDYALSRFRGGSMANTAK